MSAAATAIATHVNNVKRGIQNKKKKNREDDE